MNKKSFIRTVAENMADYLREECSQAWKIIISHDTLTGTYWDDEYFTLKCDAGKWYMTCHDLPLDITSRLYEIATNTEKEFKMNAKEKEDEEYEY